MRTALCIGILVALAACESAPSSDAFGGAPDQNGGPVASNYTLTLMVMAEAQYPGQDSDVVVSCGLQNATEAEKASLGARETETDAFLARATAAGVLSKPETRACLTANGVAL